MWLGSWLKPCIWRGLAGMGWWLCSQVAEAAKVWPPEAGYNLRLPGFLSRQSVLPRPDLLGLAHNPWGISSMALSTPIMSVRPQVCVRSLWENRLQPDPPPLHLHSHSERAPCRPDGSPVLLERGANHRLGFLMMLTPSLLPAEACHSTL